MSAALLAPPSASLAPALLYHVTPLHYLPHILQCGMLRCASVLAADGVAPRSGAKRRDRMLGLHDWVHLSTSARTPLLADKIRRGYPHALLIFDGPATLAQPGVALLPQNTKAWRPRNAFQPVTEPDHFRRLLDEHLHHDRHPSMEILVQYALGLDTLLRVAMIDGNEADLILEMTAQISPTRSVSITVEPELFPGAATYHPQTLSAVAGYFAACRASGLLLTPPQIPFD